MNDEIDGKSLDVKAQKLEQLKEIFPEFFSEGKLDLASVKQILGDDELATQDHYELSWAGKAEARREIQKRTTATLIPDKEGSINFDGSGNIFIEGENLEVLRTLQKAYFGRVQMIYIDPPYNTGSDSFIYPDDYSERKDEYERRAGQKNGGGFLNKLDLFKKNTKENGQYHSVWLSMMYPRLYLARNLLRKEGVIFVSCDDNEVDNLRLLMNEIFGEDNFVAQMVWEGANKNDARQIGICHEYVLVFARSRTDVPPSWSIAKEGVEPILREARKLRKQFGDDFDSASAALAAWYRANKASPSFMNRRFRFIDKTGVYKEDDPTAPGGRKFDLINPRTGEVIPLRPNRGWGFDQETFNKMVDEGRITFITDTSIMVRRYLHETDRLTPQSVFYQPARSASERLGRLLEAALFDFPKDERIIRQFIDMATDVNDEDCIVMDFFAGSGTTAQAVMDLNRDDGGRRTFLCVQMPEKTSEDSEAFKQGFKTISEVCKKRISTIVNQHLESANGKLEYDRDAPAPGFRSFILNYSNFKQWNAEVIDKDELLKQLEDFKEPLFKKPEDSLDLLTELLLKSGIPLATQTEQRTTSDGVPYYLVEGHLIYALDGLSDQLLKDIETTMPTMFVTLGNLFTGEKADETMTNWRLQLHEAGIDFTLI